jgi:putative endonuclease
VPQHLRMGTVTDPRRALGCLGEELAASFLAAHGFTAIARNQRTRHGELDIVAFDGDTLVFAEVKTVAGGRNGESSLGWPSARQRERIRRLAAAWLRDHASGRPRAREIRFDLIRVLVDDRREPRALEHIAGAW